LPTVVVVADRLAITPERVAPAAGPGLFGRWGQREADRPRRAVPRVSAAHTDLGPQLEPAARPAVGRGSARGRPRRSRCPRRRRPGPRPSSPGEYSRRRRASAERTCTTPAGLMTGPTYEPSHSSIRTGTAPSRGVYQRSDGLGHRVGPGPTVAPLHDGRWLIVDGDLGELGVEIDIVVQTWSSLTPSHPAVRVAPLPRRQLQAWDRPDPPFDTSAVVAEARESGWSGTCDGRGPRPIAALHILSGRARFSAANAVVVVRVPLQVPRFPAVGTLGGLSETPGSAGGPARNPEGAQELVGPGAGTRDLHPEGRDLLAAPGCAGLRRARRCRRSA